MATKKASLVIHHFYYSPLKRSLDVVVAAGLLITFIPVFGLISLTVFLTAGQPVIFKQLRSGKNQRAFWLYKFRTMKPGAEKHQPKLAAKNEAPFPMFKVHQDPRFVGIGRWLSNTGLDELPQLLNILKGEMSLIGPRPLPTSEAQILHQLYPNWRFRTLVRPGIFSEWSLDSNRHASIKHWRELDRATLTQGGLNYELKLILANTVRVISWTSKTSIQRLKLLLKRKLAPKFS